MLKIFEESVRKPCVYSSDERMLGDETREQVTGQSQKTLRATPRTLLFPLRWETSRGSGQKSTSF